MKWMLTGVAVLGSLSLLSVSASAQQVKGGPDYLGGCISGPPPPQQAGARGRGGRGFGRGRGKQAAPAAAPRLPNNPYYGVNAGKPDFGGLSKGMWTVPYIINMATQGKNVDGSSPVVIPCNAKAVQIFQKRQADDSKDDPEGFCLPPGVPRMMYTPYPTEIFQMPDRILFIYEGGAHVWRVIWMDGRQLPKDPNPNFLGYSVGHWEGDTLVVNSSGFNMETWLDAAGHPHGEQLKVTERYTRPNMNTLQLAATIDDPEYYTKPWTVVTTARWTPGGELMEYICQENNRDLQHIGAQRGGN
ncbi:MAG TPA: hypothetical protein VFW83_10750 [Bryobacteraceae bacterium]|nr:hypothetical protein [Bryobacteraceae bacterium]